MSEPIEIQCGNTFLGECPVCGDQIEVVRPGKPQCPRGCSLRVDAGAREAAPSATGDTPRTDAQPIAYGYWVPADFARELERENAHLRSVVGKFCEEHRWASEVWRRQPFIQALFDIAEENNKLTAPEGQQDHE